ncbi:MAG: cytidylate kinase-like family protein [Candidatus Eisenbacteria bacterium]
MNREQEAGGHASHEASHPEAIKPTPGETEKVAMGGPLLTVSRDFLSGGGTVANKLAAKLGWNLYDRELIESLAADVKVGCRTIEEMDENVFQYVQKWASEVFLPAYGGQAAYMKALIRVLLSIVKEGNAIVVGRGAHVLILPHRRLAVRLIAPLPIRVENYVRRFGATREEAQERIVAEDRRRKEFLSRNFQTDIDDPLGYDLVVNTADMDPNTIQQVIQAALRSRFDLTESTLARIHPEVDRDA